MLVHQYDSRKCHPRCVCETRRRYVVKHNLITEVYLMTVMETTTCFGPCWPSSGCLGNLRASYMHACARGVEISTFPRQPDDGQHGPKHVVVSITVIKYTSVIKLCLTTYLLLVSHTQRGWHFLDSQTKLCEPQIPRFNGS